MVPKSCRLLINRETGRPGFIGLNFLMRCAVHVRWNMHSVPMHRGGFAEAILNDQVDIFSSFHSQRGAEVGPVDTSRCGCASFLKKLFGGFINDKAKLTASIDYGALV